MTSKSDIFRGVVQAWGRILTGRQPNLSVEITRECPLRCPGCYAFGDAHLGGDVTLRGLSDYRGDELVERFIGLIDSRKPLHVSIVGGEPLVRYRELNSILPTLAARNIHTQLVTSAVRPIPSEWARLRRLQIVVSVDGLPPEHDQRRAPATYDRVLKHIAGHQVTVHCTVTRQQVRREGYLEEFLRFWQANADTRMIWVSLYTPQRGELSAERLTPADRQQVIDELRRLRPADPQARNVRRGARGLRPTARVAGGVHLCANDRVPVRRSPATNRALPVRGQSGLLELRVHCVGQFRGDGTPPPARGYSCPSVAQCVALGGERRLASPQTLTLCSAGPGSARVCAAQRRKAYWTPRRLQ